MAKEIELTQGYKALVDDIDFEYLRQFKWGLRDKNRGRLYAARTDGIKMHRLIVERQLDRKLETSEYVDHRDRDALNNTRSNLRLATRSQNLANRSKSPWRVTSSKFKGVCWDKSRNKWLATIRADKKLIHLGFFDDEILAAKTYDQHALLRFGEFAALNFPNELKLSEILVSNS